MRSNEKRGFLRRWWKKERLELCRWLWLLRCLYAAKGKRRRQPDELPQHAQRHELISGFHFTGVPTWKR